MKTKITVICAITSAAFLIRCACLGNETNQPVKLQSALTNTQPAIRSMPLPTFQDGVRFGAVVVLRNPDVRDLETVTRLAIAMWQQEQAGKK